MVDASDLESDEKKSRESSSLSIRNLSILKLFFCY